MSDDPNVTGDMPNINQLVEIIRDPSQRWDSFNNYVMQLRDVGNQIDISPLYEILEDRSVTQRNRAIYAIGHLGTRGQFSELVPFLEDEDPGVQSNCIWAIRELGGINAAEILVDLLWSPHRFMQADAVDNLLLLGQEFEKIRQLLPRMRDRLVSFVWGTVHCHRLETKSMHVLGCIARSADPSFASDTFSLLDHLIREGSLNEASLAILAFDELGASGIPILIREMQQSRYADLRRGLMFHLAYKWDDPAVIPFREEIVKIISVARGDSDRRIGWGAAGALRVIEQSYE